VTADQLPLQSRDEALGHRVVVGIGHRSYRRQKPWFFQLVSELHRRVLTILARVVDRPRSETAVVDDYVHGVQRTSSLMRWFAIDRLTTFVEKAFSSNER
jgi:hypothetical protein